MARARAWCFTLNNPTVGRDAYETLECRYLIVGNEVGEQGTPHHQGYISFSNPKMFGGVKRILPDGCHIEKARGTPLQNQQYCGKEEILIQTGEIPVKGRRTDLEMVREQVNAGCKMEEICQTANSFQAIRGAEILLKYVEKARDPTDGAPEVYWFWGKTGTGKTREAFSMCEDPWVSGKNLKWWDGYDAHEDVIIDDFRGDFCTFHELLRILDRYPYRVEVKGGSRQLVAKRFFITCPYPPDRVYGGIEDKDQLLRRITEIREF